MKQVIEAKVLPDNTVVPMHHVDEVCAACGYDLTQEELQASHCADCGAELEIKRSVSVFVTAVPSLGVTSL